MNTFKTENIITSDSAQVLIDLSRTLTKDLVRLEGECKELQQAFDEETQLAGNLEERCHQLSSEMVELNEIIENLEQDLQKTEFELEATKTLLKRSKKGELVRNNSGYSFANVALATFGIAPYVAAVVYFIRQSL